MVRLEWWRPCLRADLPASSSLRIVCDIAEKTKHSPEFIWSTIVVIKSTGDNSGLISDNLIIYKLITSKWHIDPSKNTLCYMYQKPKWKSIKIHRIKLQFFKNISWFSKNKFISVTDCCLISGEGGCLMFKATWVANKIHVSPSKT